MCTKILMESIVVTTHSVVNMAITSLQQLIRWSIWPLHHCSKRFGGQYGYYIVATTDSVVNMAFYIVAATCFHKQSPYFADKMNFLKKSLAPFGLF